MSLYILSAQSEQQQQQPLMRPDEDEEKVHQKEKKKEKKCAGSFSRVKIVECVNREREPCNSLECNQYVYFK